MTRPDPRPVSFLTLERGTAVVDRFGRPVGKLERVMLHEDDSFDGLVVLCRRGTRFVDAPEVRRVSAGAIVLGVSAADVENPAADGRRTHGMPQARHDRTEVTEAERDDAIDALKLAYVRDELTTEQLAERVARAHVADTLDALDAVLVGLTVG